MKIAITVSHVSPGGGLTKYVSILADILTQNGDNELSIITTHPSEKNPTLDHLMQERGIRYIYLGNLSKLKKYCVLISVLRGFAPDIVIVNYNAPTQYILPFLPRKTKIIHILHSNTPDFYRIAAINGRRTDSWIAPTAAVADHFNEFTGLKYRDKVVVIPHGVDAPICESSKNNERIRLTFTGVLYEHKGVRILPDIIRKLEAKRYDFHFTFIGDGVLRHELKQDLSRQVEDGTVEFTGRISGEEVYQRLSRTDLFIYPTHIDAFGLVIAEAMINRAVPVVTLLHGITDTIVDDGVNGYLVSQDDVDAFVERISSLIENEDLRQRMSVAAAEKALKCFSKEIMKTNYIDFIKQLTIKHP